MQINVAQLLKSETGATRRQAVDGKITIDGAIYTINGEVLLINIGKKILVQGTINAVTPLTCGRCLQEFETTLPLKIQEEFYPLFDIYTGERMETPDDGSGFTIDEHHTLDLSEAIRQYILLALPMKPLCREDCAGICQTCGKDLNQGQCACPSEASDPRWADLIKLQKKTRGSLREERGKEGRK